MNRYPLWKYIMVLAALLFGFVYTLPNLLGSAPAVQVSSNRATLKIDENFRPRVEEILAAADIENTGIFVDATGIKVRFADENAQSRARVALEKALNPAPNPADHDYVVALNFLSASPRWLTAIGALPMYQGLDLRGGVHFLLQVDMPGAKSRRLDSISADLRTLMRDRDMRYTGINREGESILLRFHDAETRTKAQELIGDRFPELAMIETEAASAEDKTFALAAALRPEALQQLGEYALKQNISTLHNRINELGVAEPVITQQGADRIVVQLPGVLDTGKAKDMIGRTATLELRMVDETPGALEAALGGSLPFGDELLTEHERDGRKRPILLKKQVVLTGERLTNAQPGVDENGQPAVHLDFDASGARVIRAITSENAGKRMAILLIEKGRAEVVTAPVIRSEIGGGRMMISGNMRMSEANDIALLLRAGSLAAPMEIIEERTVGPSLGKENIEMGFDSTLWGFVAVVAFMCFYYRVVGLISSIALTANLLFLLALLSMLQATLTLPGIAAIALTLGMAIDANVLINERIREELRAGMTPQAAIHAGYERAFDTILDSNLTTLIAGLALLIFGSGPVRGFAVVHCLGIFTSIFSAVTVSRALVNLVYGYRRKLVRVSIGQVWKSEPARAQ
ncbi:MAG: protein translocase subunit SecD [Zoogloeaceae bacterium]|jgi:preprotein translocase subunit SecD|nr:protein translocase subunit SecD [Zoogloeaceae bacterium]